MPIYEFQCQACGVIIEVLQKISDPHLTDCEACGKAEMKKKVTAAAFRLSGAGWYETDFKEGDNKKNLTEASAEKETSSNDKDQSSNTDKSEKKETSASSDNKSTDKSQEKSTPKTETSSKDKPKTSPTKDSSKD